MKIFVGIRPIIFLVNPKFAISCIYRISLLVKFSEIEIVVYDKNRVFNCVNDDIVLATVEIIDKIYLVFVVVGQLYSRHILRRIELDTEFHSIQYKIKSIDILVIISYRIFRHFLVSQKQIDTVSDRRSRNVSKEILFLLT